MTSKVIIRDWSELPPELIERIAGTLDSIPYYVIFGAVCKSWRSAARSINPSSIPQLPWLYSVDYFTDRLHLHDPWKPGSQKTYIFPIPVDHKESLYLIYGSAYGCVLVYEYTIGHISLFNPLLPERSSSWFTLPHLPSDYYGHSSNVVDLQLLKYGNGGYCVIFNSEVHHNPLCWRSGDSSWTKLYDNPVYQCIFHKGSFYLVDFADRMIVVDATNLTVTSRFRISYFGIDLYPYLVESSSGEMLVVMTDARRIHQHQVMRVDLSQQPPILVKVKSIGDDALFMMHKSVICFPVTKSKGLKRNCIYYYYNGTMSGQYNLYSLDIGNGKTGTKLFIHKQDVSWLIPSLSTILE